MAIFLLERQCLFLRGDHDIFVQVVGDLDAAQTEQCLNGTGGFFNDYM
jgi:hypothetical protein